MDGTMKGTWKREGDTITFTPTEGTGTMESKEAMVMTLRDGKLHAESKKEGEPTLIFTKS